MKAASAHGASPLFHGPARAGWALFVIVVTQGFGTASHLLENLVGDQADQSRQNSKYKHVPHSYKTPFSIPPYGDYALSIAAASVFTSLPIPFICGSVRPAFQSRDGYLRIAALWRHAMQSTSAWNSRVTCFSGHVIDSMTCVTRMSWTCHIRRLDCAAIPGRSLRLHS